MRPFRIRVLTTIFAIALSLFAAIPVSADPVDGGTPSSGGGAEVQADPIDGGVGD